jgi:hypothetical protein
LDFILEKRRREGERAKGDDLEERRRDELRHEKEKEREGEETK